MSPAKTVKLLKEAAAEYFHDNGPGLGAALAFYSMLSIGPLLLFALGVAGLFFDHDAAQRNIIAETRHVIGPIGAEAVQQILSSLAPHDKTNIVATVIGAVTLLIGALGTYEQLQYALNVIWKVHVRVKETFWGHIKRRFLSFSMMLAASFLLLVSLAITTALAAASGYASAELAQFPFVLPMLDAVINIVAITLLFAMIFKYIPDIDIAWRDVTPGALLTAVLFVLGKFAIGFYLGRSTLIATYGAAGSLVVILIWVYYSAQILFFGAEFTQVYAKHNSPKKLGWFRRIVQRFSFK